MLIAGVMGFAYWWPSFWIIGVAAIVGTIWIEVGSLAKAFAIVMLLGIATMGWGIPLSTTARPSNGFSIAPFFWAAGVTLWRLVPIAVALAIAAPRRRRR